MKKNYYLLGYCITFLTVIFSSNHCIYGMERKRRSTITNKGEETKLESDIFCGPLTQTPEFNTRLAKRARKEIIENKEIERFGQGTLLEKPYFEKRWRAEGVANGIPCIYCTKSDAPLYNEIFSKEELLKQPYAQRVLAMTQEQKDAELKDRLNDHCGDPQYYHHRWHYAMCVAAGADINVKNLLMKCFSGMVILGDYSLPLFLLQHGANPNKKSFFPLEDAKNEYIARLLVAFGADVFAESNLLLRAVWMHKNKSSVGLLRYLLDCGLDVNYKNDFGILDYFARYVNKYEPNIFAAKLRIVLHKGAELDSKDNYLNQTAEEIARSEMEKKPNDKQAQENGAYFLRAVDQERVRRISWPSITENWRAFLKGCTKFSTNKKGEELMCWSIPPELVKVIKQYVWQPPYEFPEDYFPKKVSPETKRVSPEKCITM